MKKRIVVDIICYALVILFVYAAASKLFDYQKFQVQLGQSPLLTRFSGWVAWMIPTAEILIALALLNPAYRVRGLYASFTLMTAFTAYIFAITHSSGYIPCSCGGILQHLSWGQHFVFNIFFIVAAAMAVFMSDDKNRVKTQSISTESS